MKARNAGRRRFIMTILDLLVAVGVVTGGRAVVPFTIPVIPVARATPASNDAAGKLVEKAVAFLEEARDASVTVTVVQFDPKSGREVGRMKSQVQVTAKPPVVRVLFLEPAALEGQLVILDGEKDRAYLYSPVTEEVVVQSVAMAARQLGLPAMPGTGAGSGAGGFGVEGLLGIVPKEGAGKPGELAYTARLVRYEKWRSAESAAVVDVSSTAFPIGKQRLWILQESGQVVQVETYDAQDRLMVRVVLDSFQKNLGLRAEQLLQLPKGARIVQ